MKRKFSNDAYRILFLFKYIAYFPIACHFYGAQKILDLTITVQLTYYIVAGYYALNSLNKHFYRIIYPSSLFEEKLKKKVKNRKKRNPSQTKIHFHKHLWWRPTWNGFFNIESELRYLFIFYRRFCLEFFACRSCGCQFFFLLSVCIVFLPHHQSPLQFSSLSAYSFE